MTYPETIQRHSVNDDLHVQSAMNSIELLNQMQKLERTSSSRQVPCRRDNTGSRRLDSVFNRDRPADVQAVMNSIKYLSEMQKLERTPSYSQVPSRRNKTGPSHFDSVFTEERFCAPPRKPSDVHVVIHSMKVVSVMQQCERTPSIYEVPYMSNKTWGPSHFDSVFTKEMLSTVSKLAPRHPARRLSTHATTSAA
jgi:hypothetical protein